MPPEAPEQVDQLVDELLDRQAQLAAGPGQSDLRGRPDEGVGPQSGAVAVLAVGSDQREPGLDGGGRETVAVPGQGALRGFEGEEAQNPGVFGDSSDIGLDGGTSVAGSPGHDRRRHPGQDAGPHLLEDSFGQGFDRRKALVEVALGEPGFGTDVADSDRREAWIPMDSCGSISVVSFRGAW